MAAKAKALGFGFDPDESEHHFLVTIPTAKKDYVYISEHFSWHPEEETKFSYATGKEDNKLRSFIDRYRWDQIADETQRVFNARLKKSGLKVGKWKSGPNPLSRLLGKELTLLVWAIEDTDPALIFAALKNWEGLAPEERWWLFTMTNAATGHAVTGRGIGWRKAVRFALTENPVGEMPKKRATGLFEGLDD